jgi:hypothetical protein
MMSTMTPEQMIDAHLANVEKMLIEQLANVHLVTWMGENGDGEDAPPMALGQAHADKAYRLIIETCTYPHLMRFMMNRVWPEAREHAKKLVEEMVAAGDDPQEWFKKKETGA